MKRSSLIAATFGGVLAAGFLTVSAPVAHALPCDSIAKQGTMACHDCVVASNANPSAFIECGMGIGVPVGPPTNGPAYGRDRACAESGICPGAAWVNRNGGLKTQPCVHFPDDPPGLCAPLSGGPITPGAMDGLTHAPCQLGVNACYLPDPPAVDIQEPGKLCGLGPSNQCIPGG